MTLKEFMVEAITEKLEEMEGIEVYGCDLGYQLFEEANVNGSYTCDAFEAQKWIREHFEELGEVVEDIKFNLGENSICNPFLEPEKFMVIVILELSSTLIGQCQTVENNWNNTMELTAETIKQIIKELNTK